MARVPAVLLVTVQLLAGFHFSCQRSTPSSPSYKAAVLEYAPPLGVTLDNQDLYLQYNIDIYLRVVLMLAECDVDIVVFPEMGLVSLSLPRLSDGTPSLWFTVPSAEDAVNPCVDMMIQYQALRQLSCAARNNSIYVVVNLPEKAGDVFYNTNVVFDRQGTVIARYRKFNLFGEEGFSSPAQPDFTTFETDFGVRFGIFTCFDLMFETPAVRLVKEHSVTDIVFPTAWFSELPFLTAVQAQEGWSRALDVNFLAAGYNYPQVGSGGSGIYAGERGAIKFRMPEDRGSFFIITSVPKKNATGEFVPESVVIPLNTTSPSKQDVGKELASRFFLKREDLDNYHRYVINSTTLDPYSIRCEQYLRGQIFCIEGEMEKSSTDKDDNRAEAVYFWVTYKGNRSFSGVAEGSMLVSAVILCANSDFNSCGYPIDTTTTKVLKFKRLSVSANFNKRKHFLAMPSTLMTEGLLPIPASNFELKTEDRKGDEVFITMSSKVEQLSFLTFAIYGRNFSDDPPKPEPSASSSHAHFFVVCFLLPIALILGSGAFSHPFY